MFSIKNDKVREFCRDVFDVEYLVGWDISKRNLNSEQNYVDLELLYSFNDSRISSGQKPFVQILTDDVGLRYAQLSEEGAEYALSNDLSFMLECKERNNRNVLLKEAKHKLVDNSLEDKICEHCGMLLGSGYAKSEYYQMLDKKSTKQKILNKKYGLLTSVDIPGGYMN
jgi:hypothetical protein